MVNQFMVNYIKSLNKQKARWGERQDAYVLTDGVQVVLSKCVRRTDQDWSKDSPLDKFQWLFAGISDQTIEAGLLPQRGVTVLVHDCCKNHPWSPDSCRR